jgi:hypothetical protein
MSATPFIKRKNEVYCNGIQLTPIQKLKYYILENGGYTTYYVLHHLDQNEKPLDLLDSFTLKYMPIYNNNVFAWYFFILEIPGESPSIFMMRSDLNIRTTYTLVGLAHGLTYSNNTAQKVKHCIKLIQDLNLSTNQTDNLTILN